MLTVVGGVYRERVAREDWDEYLGSAGRAAETIVALGGQVELHTYLDEAARVSLDNRNRDHHFRVEGASVERVAGFSYLHGLASPMITAASKDHEPLSVSASAVVAYGMIAGNARIEADYAVYDAQNTDNPRGFRANGSKANHLAVVVNRHEAATMLGLSESTSPEELVRALAEHEHADVVILKNGPVGALVWSGDVISFVPPYRTSKVFKVGSGDVFVAAFAHGWIELKLSAAEAADRASRATAYYVQHRQVPTGAELDSFQPMRLLVTDAARARADGQAPRLKIYLAGPFFTLAQYWMVEEACAALYAMGFEVLSPYHLVGPGPAEDVVEADLHHLDQADLVLAIGDGMDAGTVFEVGYAHKKGLPVIFYAENEVGEDRKMFVGTGCHMCGDFTTAVYHAVWSGLAL